MYKEVERCTGALKSYITSTYHISHPVLVAQREELLSSVGSIAQRPLLESTARYKTSRMYEELDISEDVALFLFGLLWSRSSLTYYLSSFIGLGEYI